MNGLIPLSAQDLDEDFFESNDMALVIPVIELYPLPGDPERLFGHGHTDAGEFAQNAGMFMAVFAKIHQTFAAEQVQHGWAIGFLNPATQQCHLQLANSSDAAVVPVTYITLTP